MYSLSIYICIIHHVSCPVHNTYHTIYNIHHTMYMYICTHIHTYTYIYTYIKNTGHPCRFPIGSHVLSIYICILFKFIVTFICICTSNSRPARRAPLAKLVYGKGGERILFYTPDLHPVLRVAALPSSSMANAGNAFFIHLTLILCVGCRFAKLIYGRGGERFAKLIYGKGRERTFF